MEGDLQYKNYFASVHFNAEDGFFFGKIEGINDFVRFEGCSLSELRKSFHEAVDDYLENCRLMGKSPAA